MILLILAMAIIVTLLLFVFAPDNYSDWNKEYIDEEFKKLKLKKYDSK